MYPGRHPCLPCSSRGWPRPACRRPTCVPTHGIDRRLHGGLLFGKPTMKTVILCGGLGTRLREETEFRPKPMVEIGGRPILWHIMKMYAHHGFRDFVLCLGYRGNIIKEYFLN